MIAAPRRGRTLAERVFHAALRVLPEDMRDRDGGQIEALFAEESAAARAG